MAPVLFRPKVPKVLTLPWLLVGYIMHLAIPVSNQTKETEVPLSSRSRVVRHDVSNESGRVPSQAEHRSPVVAITLRHAQPKPD